MAEWKISNDLPYLDEFPALYQITEYPNSLWKQVNGELPYKSSFPELIKFTDVLHNMWVVSEENKLPYKLCFPPLYPPRKEKKPKYKTFQIVLYDYFETIPIEKGVR